jgi:hypothetical protein
MSSSSSAAAAGAWSAVWQRWTDRSRARFTSERVPQHNSILQSGGSLDEEEEEEIIDTEAPQQTVTSALSEEEEEEEGHFQNEPLTASARATAASRAAGTAASRTAGTEASTTAEATAHEPDGVTHSHDEEMGDATIPAAATTTSTTTTRFTTSQAISSATLLTQLQQERELIHRRRSVGMVFLIFVLSKLWIDCVTQPSVPLLLLCFIATSWTARWIQYNRDQQDNLDRQINALYLQQQQRPQGANENQDNDRNNDMNNPSFIMNREDLHLLSFQAQLALAIMESQRQYLQGGLPDHDTPATPGVSDTTKQQWKVITYKDDEDVNKKASTMEQHLSNSRSNNKNNNIKDNVDAPHCSICLCEYETNERLYELPCTHVFHQECIDSWTSNHTKCPLCNMELEPTQEQE